MQIDDDILIAYGGVAKKLKKGMVIFWEGDYPLYFYQIIAGGVTVFSSNEEGKDLIQGIFGPGQSFGEPPLLLGRPYPSTAKTNADTVVIRISKEKLLHMLYDFPEVSQQLLLTFADRIYKKAQSAQVWVAQSPEAKITSAFNRMKNEQDKHAEVLIPYTRQQLADFTGLRVETIIRTLTRMNREGKVKIINRKVYY